jgi:hypothetical protein
MPASSNKLDPKFVANDLVNYTFIKKALDANPEVEERP